MRVSQLIQTVRNPVQTFHGVTKGDGAWVTCNGSKVLELRYSGNNGGTARRDGSPLRSSLMFTVSYCGSIATW